MLSSLPLEDRDVADVDDVAVDEEKREDEDGDHRGILDDDADDIDEDGVYATAQRLVKSSTVAAWKIRSRTILSLQ